MMNLDTGMDPTDECRQRAKRPEAEDRSAPKIVKLVDGQMKSDDGVQAVKLSGFFRRKERRRQD